MSRRTKHKIIVRTKDLYLDQAQPYSRSMLTGQLVQRPHIVLHKLREGEDDAPFTINRLSMLFDFVRALGVNVTVRNGSTSSTTYYGDREVIPDTHLKPFFYGYEHEEFSGDEPSMYAKLEQAMRQAKEEFLIFHVDQYNILVDVTTLDALME